MEEEKGDMVEFITTGGVVEQCFNEILFLYAVIYQEHAHKDAHEGTFLHTAEM